MLGADVGETDEMTHTSARERADPSPSGFFFGPSFLVGPIALIELLLARGRKKRAFPS